MNPWLKGVFYLKKLSAFVMGSILVTALIFCGMHVAALTRNEPEGKLLMLADEGALSEDAAKYALWQELCGYAEEHHDKALLITAPSEAQEARMQALENNLSPSVRVVIAMGKDDANFLYEAQQRFPEVNFLLVDAEPRRSSDSVYETRTNTHCLLFEEKEAGFLAGFAAVMEGKRNLGFCGEGTDQDVILYGYGVIQGAEEAAKALGLKRGAVELRYWYVEAGVSREGIQAVASQWYEKGTQVISVCDHGDLSLTNAVIAAAEEKDGLVLGSGAERNSQRGALLSSTRKDYGGQLQAALASLEENRGRWNADRAGRSVHVGVSECAVSLAEEPNAWRFQSFSQESYEALLEGLREGRFSLDQGGNRERLPLSPHCTVKLQNN